MRAFLKFKRRWREARMFARAMASPGHPILAQIIPIRRCNLACTYCNEFDKDSRPVPTSEMLQRIDQLSAHGTSIITFSGGEPTLHPDLDLLVRRVRALGKCVLASRHTGAAVRFTDTDGRHVPPFVIRESFFRHG